MTHKRKFDQLTPNTTLKSYTTSWEDSLRFELSNLQLRPKESQPEPKRNKVESYTVPWFITLKRGTKPRCRF